MFSKEIDAIWKVFQRKHSFLKKHTYLKVQLLCGNSCFLDEKEFSFEAMARIQGALLEILLAVASSYYGVTLYS